MMRGFERLDANARNLTGSYAEDTLALSSHWQVWATQSRVRNSKLAILPRCTFVTETD